MMEDYLQTEWADLRVWLTSTTEQWTVIAVQGPNARAVIAPLIEGLDVSADAFPHMSIADAHICGVPMRLMRVSFTGELGFRSEEHTSELQSLMRNSYALFCLKKKT